MNKLRTVCSHLTVILSLVFIVFLVLDQACVCQYIQGFPARQARITKTGHLFPVRQDGQ